MEDQPSETKQDEIVGWASPLPAPVLAFLGFLLPLIARPYYLALTDRRLFVSRASSLTLRIRRETACPLAEAKVSVRAGWIACRLEVTTEGRKPLRLFVRGSGDQAVRFAALFEALFRGSGGITRP